MNKIYQEIQEMNRKTRDWEVKEKLRLFLLVKKMGSISRACERYHKCRGYYYKWWGRFNRSGYRLNSLKEKSKRPNKSPFIISQEIERHIKGLARRGYGSRMIQGMLRRDQIKVSHTTINHVLNGRQKGVRKKRRRINPHRRRYELHIPGERLQMDVKYCPEFIEGKRVYVYVAIDECTRWRYAKAMPELNEHMTTLFLDALIKQCPFPIHCIQTDNGPEFTFRLLGENTREHLMDNWCKEHRIRHRCIPPGEKELNGKVERSHRIDMQYFYLRRRHPNLESFNNALGRWIDYYNHTRLHGGIGYITPIEKLNERVFELNKNPLNTPKEFMRLKFIKHCPINPNKELRLFNKVDLLYRKSRWAA